MFWIILMTTVLALIIFLIWMELDGWKRVILRSIQLRYDEIRIRKILDRGIEVFGDEKKFRRWLCSKIQALGNRRPIDVLRETGGKEQVLTILGRIEHGVYS